MSHLPPLGAHVSVAGGMPNAIAHATSLGCTAAQIFVKNGSQWRWKETGDEEAAAFRAAHAASAVGPLVAHASYLINLCSADPALLARSREALIDELTRCARLGVEGLVLHPGAHLGAGEEAGVERVAASLDAVLAALPGSPVRVLLENTAGQGSCLGHRLEHLEAIRARVAEPGRVGVCLDTCHAFAAGYAIHEPAGYAELFAEVEERIGLGALGCMHLNDSLRPFNSRRDRHAHIGEGEIGLDAFARLLHDPRLENVPMILETETGDDLEGHRRDLETLRRLFEDGKATRPAAGRRGGSSSGRTRSPRTSAAGSSRSRPG
ncbi:MAG TPA: deoxyribonuclease IV [Thermoanaerobaculia bacterium]|jgi:deoxyribonuclease-4|nr:deoxyribonuclease IV [Thermoanaerobaculia bacterium]